MELHSIRQVGEEKGNDSPFNRRKRSAIHPEVIPNIIIRE